MIRTVLHLNSSDPGIKWPIVLADSGDLFVFDDPHALNLWVEPVDVPASEVFNAAGQRLELSVAGSEVSARRADIFGP